MSPRAVHTPSNTRARAHTGTADGEETGEIGSWLPAGCCQSLIKGTVENTRSRRSSKFEVLQCIPRENKSVTMYHPRKNESVTMYHPRIVLRAFPLMITESVLRGSDSNRRRIFNAHYFIRDSSSLVRIVCDCSQACSDCVYPRTSNVKSVRGDPPPSLLYKWTVPVCCSRELSPV